MAGAGSFDQRTRGTGEEFACATRSFFDFRVQRADRFFLQAIELFVITHFILILVGNGTVGNAGGRATTLNRDGRIIKPSSFGDAKSL